MKFKYGVYAFEELVEEFDTVEEADNRAEELRDETGLPYVVSTVNQELTDEQFYWSLNGAFGALAQIIDLIDEGKIHNLADARFIATRQAQDISAKMTELEGLTPEK
ncbi:hypothetical protein PQE66_gp175 [Bacillus phage PBC2]|uniref:Uncharacterized protein n=1 Tax=Bacillus phage PBC2 TaxID=1675029 RepID=A0A218KC73_9CAUD|nr:hypothetical protein PQE66_gp175 [Bacillus phage PBC2]AKQ08490.1 hypothetical protein PBC2_175 [Bacillus phage PBC2]